MTRTIIFDVPIRRPGYEFWAAIPFKVIEIREHHDKRGLIAITKRGAYWIRKGRRAKRISVQS